jgi:HrpA-like RNA helicase
LLRQFQFDGGLNCITTIVVDEVHERNLDSDILLGLLRKVLPTYPHLSVVLMSATLDTERFKNYWGSTPVPHVHIQGRTFPVVDFLLEDVLNLTGFIPSKKKKGFKFSNAVQVTPWDDSEKVEEEQVGNGDVDKGCLDINVSIGASLEHGIRIDDLVKRVDEASPDSELIFRLVKYIVTNKDPADDGSILVFLAGAQEIKNVEETINNRKDGLRITLLPLHGGLQPKEQNLVFQPARRGFTKVILSTNVAVIDT